MNLQSRRVRQAFTPLFDKYGVDFCYAGHDQSYKRTRPIKAGRVDPLGTVYLGDGGYAIGETRVPKAPGNWWTGGRWYLARSASANHFQLCTLDGPIRRFQAINAADQVIDEYAMNANFPAPMTIDAPPRAWVNTWWWLPLVGIAVVGFARWRRRRRPAARVPASPASSRA